MQKRFVYFYLMKENPDRVLKVVPDHINYWTTKNLPEYAGGPFSDRSGGMITFLSDSADEATEIIMNDPFLEEKMIKEKWIKEWLVE